METATIQSQPTTTEGLSTFLAQSAVLAKVAKSAADKAWKEAEDQAIRSMEADGMTTIELADETLVTVVRAERRSVDVEILAETLPASVLDKITTTVRVLDKDALAEAIKSGLVSVADVNSATTVGEAKPALRITARPKKPTK